MDNAIENKLKALYHFQLLDSKIDEIQSIRGELPMEIKDLEDEISGLQTRQDKLNSELESFKKQITEQKNKADEAGQLIEKYEKQQHNVKNNREYVALSKEIELQKLEVQAAEKKVKEGEDSLSEKEEAISKAQKQLEEKQNDLDEKQKELQKIVDETEREENEIRKLKDEAVSSLEKRLVKAYERIRQTVVNGQAVVTIERDACGGCHSKIPPQRQLDIRQRNRIIVCENCGRIVIDNALAEELQETIGKKLEKQSS